MFDVIYVTPAFPSQGRTVSAGTLHSGTTGRSVSIIEGLAAEGLTATVVTPGAELPLSGVVVCDAATEADLTGLVEKVAPGERMLWCGSAGLARAMAGATTSVTTTPTLAIIGSRHPVSRAQGAMLAASLGASCARLRDVRDISAECAAIAAALLSYGRAALVFELPEMTDVAAERVYCETFGALAGLSQPTSIVVVGGDTLFRLVSAIGVRGLRVLGEHSPGVPVSQLEGGRWDGTIVTSKSGAFSDSGLFQTFVHGELQSA